MADNREFDRFIEEELAELPLPDLEAEEITPWRRSMGQILWGIGLTTLTLNFWYLNYLLPAVGVVLLWLGFRTLRRENGWFAVCWVLAMLEAAEFILLRARDATLWAGTPVPFGAALLVLGLVQSFCLWQGIRGVRRKAGQPDRAGAAAALIVFRTLLGALGLLGGGTIQVQGWAYLVFFLGVYICVMRSLSKLPALLDGAGYEVKAAPVRMSDRGVWLAYTVALAACLVLAGLLFSRYPMEWTPRARGEQAGLEQVRENLLELGMPVQVAEDLAPADLAALEGALSVTTQVSEIPFNEGREVRSTYGNHTQIRTVYDVKELRLDDIAVELPEGRWRIIHHFLWQEDPGLRTTEAIKLWSTDRLDGWRMDGEITGRLLYDWAGTTYTGDYYRISTETYVSDSIFFGRSQNTDPFALFSLPRRGDACRGYLTYGVETVEEGWILDSWNNYTHQVKWLNYPAMTAQEYDMSGTWNGFGAFHTSQTAIQFNPWRGTEKGSYQVVTDK